MTQAQELEGVQVLAAYEGHSYVTHSRASSDCVPVPLTTKTFM